MPVSAEGTGLLAGKTGVISGALDPSSLAWALAEAAYRDGARLVLTNAPVTRRFGKINELAEAVGNAPVIYADATSDDELASLFAETKEHFGGPVDFVVHSIGMGMNVRKGKAYEELNYDWYHRTLDVSAISLHRMVRAALEGDALADNGSVLAMSYIGAQRIFSEYSEMGDAKEQAGAIVEAARKEAEAIEAEAEEQADQRAAKVISKAREEADQVRQTVATLTAQAEDARSAALRSKLEAEDLAETQRSIGDARDDIVSTAKKQVEETERETAVAAEASLAAARTEADKLKTESEEKARSVIAAAEEKAKELLDEAEKAAELHQQETDQVASGDDLAALLKEAEQEVAMSEELRRQREEIIQREQALVEKERDLEAKKADAAMMLTSSRGGEAPVADVEPSTRPPVSEQSDEEPVPTEFSAEDEDDEHDDPAERLSALLEQVAPAGVDIAIDEPLDLDQLSQDLDRAPKTRMAWPTPVISDPDTVWAHAWIPAPNITSDNPHTDPSITAMAKCDRKIDFSMKSSG